MRTGSIGARMQCPYCHAEVNGEESVFCIQCGTPLPLKDSCLTPSVSVPPQTVLKVESCSPVDDPSARKPFAMTQKLAVVMLSLVMACLVVAIGVLGYATLKGSSSASSALPDIVPVEINDATFPDEAFRNYVSAHFDSDADGMLSPNELSAVEHIGQVDEATGSIIDPGVTALGIETLDGIRYFTNLQSLLCADNKINSINLSENGQLEYLDCRNNPHAVIVVPDSGEPSRVEKDPDTNVQYSQDDALSDGGDAPRKDEPDVDGDELGDVKASSVQVASAATCQYKGEWYAGGTLEGAVDEAGRTIEVSFDGIRPVGMKTSSFLIKNDYVYYLDASSTARHSSPDPVDLCRQTLGGNGSDKKVLASLVLDSSTFYCVGDSLYLNAIADDGKAKDPVVRPVRVSLEGGSKEGLGAMRRVVGATEEHLYYLKPSGTAVYRCNADLSGEAKMPDMAVADARKSAYGLCVNGSLWTVRATASATHLSVVSPEGASLLEQDIEGASGADGAWSDGRRLYIPVSAGKCSLCCVDLKTGKTEESIVLSCQGEDGVVALYVDEAVCYYRVDALPPSKNAAVATKDASSARSSAASLGESTVFRQDRATGEVETVATWMARES